jgi:hypothetical protein
MIRLLGNRGDKGGRVELRHHHFLVPGDVGLVVVDERQILEVVPLLLPCQRIEVLFGNQLLVEDPLDLRSRDIGLTCLELNVDEVGSLTRQLFVT